MAIVAGTSVASETQIDFASLPSSALDSYIAYYDLAKGYPPPPSKRSPSPEPAADDDEEGDGAADGAGGRRGSRASGRNIEEGHAVTTSSRLRPRSPSSSVAHLFPGGPKRNAAAAGLDENGHDNSAGNKDGDAPCPSHFFDVQEADEYLAGVAGKHFAAQPQPKEGEVVVQFLYRCRAGGGFHLQTRSARRYLRILSCHPSLDKCLKVAT